MKRFILGGLTVKENLVIFLVLLIPSLLLFQLWKVSFAPKPVKAPIVVDTFVEQCTAHGGCLFMDEIPKGMLNH